MKKLILILFMLIGQLTFAQYEVNSLKINNTPITKNDSTLVDILAREKTGSNKGYVRKITWGYLFSALNIPTNTSDLVNDGATGSSTYVQANGVKTIEGQSLLGSGNIDLTKSDVGLGNVDNTSDVNKPVSTAQQTALNLKANLAGGNTFTGSQISNGSFTLNEMFRLSSGQTTGAMRIGADVNAFTNTTNSRKLGRITSVAYDSTNSVGLIAADNDGTENNVDYGGSPSSVNYTATRHRWLVGANTVTTGGTQVANLFRSGAFVLQNGGTFTDDGVNRLQVDGSGKFTGTVTGATPTTSTHLTTKGYVDTALGLKANLDSPSFINIPTAPTATAGTNTTQIATTAFVTGTVNNKLTNGGDAGFISSGSSDNNNYSLLRNGSAAITLKTGNFIELASGWQLTQAGTTTGSMFMGNSTNPFTVLKNVSGSGVGFSVDVLGTTTGDLARFRLNNTVLSGVRVDGRVYGTTPTATNDFTTKSYVDGLAPGQAINTTTVGLSSSTLNSTYPDVPIGYRVICGNITLGGAIYTKYSEAGSSDVWLMTSAPVQP